jgi:hypothetical protein
MAKSNPDGHLGRLRNAVGQGRVLCTPVDPLMEESDAVHLLHGELIHYAHDIY